MCILTQENQDVLLYYSLLEFRHKLMLAYMYPNA
ncbi:response regulator aspartate phosphatase, partial [Bacillus velezensis]